MSEQELHVLMEVQYLKGRLDELEFKAKPHVFSLHKSRKLDVRIDKYYKKLKNTSELAYHLHMVERANVRASKVKLQKNMQELLTSVRDILMNEEFKHVETLEALDKQLNKYE
jgi:hypothetical protein